MTVGPRARLGGKVLLGQTAQPGTALRHPSDSAEIHRPPHMGSPQAASLSVHPPISCATLGCWAPRWPSAGTLGHTRLSAARPSRGQLRSVVCEEADWLPGWSTSEAPCTSKPSPGVGARYGHCLARKKSPTEERPPASRLEVEYSLLRRMSSVHT